LYLIAIHILILLEIGHVSGLRHTYNSSLLGSANFEHQHSNGRKKKAVKQDGVWYCILS